VGFGAGRMIGDAGHVVAVPRRLSQDPDRLFRRRIVAGLTQQELAWRAGLVKSTVSRLERGFASAEPATLQALAAALVCPVEDLMPELAGRRRDREG
jgi:transcriptional regulator with XRE-family HTH domain